MFWFWLARALFVGILFLLGGLFQPFGEPLWTNLVGAAVLAAFTLVVEDRLRRTPLPGILGATAGGLVGLLFARVLTSGLAGAALPDRRFAFLNAAVVLALGFLGLVAGGRHADWFDPSRWVGGARGAAAEPRHRILDTSVIIDGRIADVCEAGFLDGTLVVPQFVLRELQYIADSSDSLKRNRGRRGLDILQKIQKMAGVDVVVSDVDFPDVKEVDLKLIELARTMGGKIVTNDFNLNNVAQLRGIQVLNINELANALKPVVLPGEFMKVFILKEGKEYNQGVAYLDDGTMVVVDNARRLIGKTIDVVVTSVLQTTAGKMIFGRHIEPGTGAHAATAAAGGAPLSAAGSGGRSVEGEDVARRPRPISQA